MLDELKVRLAEQRIGYEDYLRATERDEAQLIESFRPDAEKRVKTLLVLGEIADKEEHRVSDAELDAEPIASRRPMRAIPASSPISSRRAGAATRVPCYVAQRPSRRSSIAGSSSTPSSKDVQHLQTTTTHDHDHEHEEGEN
jgi:hypothetical protein